MRSFIVLIATVALTGGCSQPETEVPPTVTVLSPDTPVRVTGGQVQGVVSDENPEIVRFKGIPFAAPPVGELRWRPPAAVVGWEGVRDASTSGAICPQWRGDSAVGEEDCLSLNVWAPRETTEPLPVMVWIHGGGYRLGSGSGPGSDGTPLASKGVVLVTINYRLNVFGFLAHPALSAESPQNASGNYGLMDMVAALEWVRDNVATFGGDPGRVTIFGESAGGGAVMALMIVPQAEGLFHRGIAQSTYIHGWDRPLRDPARGWEPAEAIGRRLGEALGATGDDTLTALRAAPTAKVFEASDVGPLFKWAGTLWAPNVDGWYIPDDPLAMYADTRQHDVPLIAGMTDNEGSLFRSRFEIEGVADFESYVQADFGGVAAEMLGYYDVATADAVTPGLNHLVHDMFFAGPVRVQVRAHGDVSSPAWLYHFAQVPPTQMGTMFGAHHASELSYVFGTMAAAAGVTWTDADRQVSDRMMDYWTEFAASGDPNREGLPAWPSFEDATGRYLTLAEPTVSGTGLHRDGAALFDQFEAHRRSESHAGHGSSSGGN